mgnify:CR=1 FL=1
MEEESGRNRLGCREPRCAQERGETRSMEMRESRVFVVCCFFLHDGAGAAALGLVSTIVAGARRSVGVVSVILYEG